MAAMKAASTSCLHAFSSQKLYQSFAFIRNVDERVIATSESLTLLRNGLMEKLVGG